MRPILTDRVAWSLCRSVSRSVTVLNPAKTAEPIEMSFGLWARVSSGNHALNGGSDIHGKGKF